MPRSIVAHCRPGFEAECARDLERIATHAGLSSSPGASFRAARSSSATAPRSRRRAGNPRWPSRRPGSRVRSSSATDRIGCRAQDRITPLLALAREQEPPFSAIWLETPDSNDGKRQAGMCRRMAPLLSAAAQGAGLLADSAAHAPARAVRRPRKRMGRRERQPQPAARGPWASPASRCPARRPRARPASSPKRS